MNMESFLSTKNKIDSDRRFSVYFTGWKETKVLKRQQRACRVCIWTCKRKGLRASSFHDGFSL